MNGNRPNLTLNMDEKIYLAVAKRDLDKLSFVYTLACLKSGKNVNTYNIVPSRQIHAFKNKESAQLYHDTIEQIVDENMNDEAKQPLFKANDVLIERFMEYTR
jgi:hypothetical protein